MQEHPGDLKDTLVSDDEEQKNGSFFGTVGTRESKEHVVNVSNTNDE